MLNNASKTEQYRNRVMQDAEDEGIGENDWKHHAKPCQHHWSAHAIVFQEKLSSYFIKGPQFWA